MINNFLINVYIHISGDSIYWTDWVLHAVLRADKLTGDNVVFLRKNIAKPMGIIAVANDTDDCFSNPCLVLNGDCEEICKLTANASIQCSCTDGHILAEDGLRCYKNITTCNGELCYIFKTMIYKD